MRTDEFDFHLPADLIAQHPAVPRDSSRLLEVGAMLADYRMTDLPRRLRRGDVVVFNDTKVIPARLFGHRDGARVELMLHRRIDKTTWRAFSRPARRLRPDDRIAFGPDFEATVREKTADGEVILELAAGEDIADALQRYGTTPLPPYIKRAHGPESADASLYQTVYAANDGAVAAPTAGLHFTPSLLAALDAVGVVRVMVTLHVGAGTFLPVKTDQAKDHRMHPEFGMVSDEAAATINRARGAGGRLVAVGTTVLRLLETATRPDGTIAPFEGETSLFILPGYRFKSADLMLTNFHLPRSTLFMLVSAFAGLERMKAAYAHAIEQKFRFYSYGDGCLLHRADRL